MFTKYSNNLNKIPKIKIKLFFYFIFKILIKLIEISQNYSEIKIHKFFFIFHKSDKITKFYKFKKFLGSGSFGVVHKVRHKQKGGIFVLK